MLFSILTRSGVQMFFTENREMTWRRKPKFVDDLTKRSVLVGKFACNILNSLILKPNIRVFGETFLKPPVKRRQRVMTDACKFFHRIGMQIIPKHHIFEVHIAADNWCKQRCNLVFRIKITKQEKQFFLFDFVKMLAIDAVIQIKHHRIEEIAQRFANFQNRIVHPAFVELGKAFQSEFFAQIYRAVKIIEQN